MYDAVTVGFAPTPAGAQGSFVFLQNFLPLANHLSDRSGTLVSFLEERNASTFRKDVLENKYPAILVDAHTTGDALNAGYFPLAMSVEDVRPALLVRSDSKIKRIEDVSDARVAWQRDSFAAPLAQYELASRGLADRNQYKDVPVLSRAASGLAQGTYDVLAASSTDAARLSSESAGKFRVINLNSSLPAVSLWIRRDQKGTDFSKRLSAAALQVGPDATGSARHGAEGMARGFGLSGLLRKVRPDELEQASTMVDVVAGSRSDFAFHGHVSTVARNANLALPVFTKAMGANPADLVSENNALRARFREGFNVGISAVGAAADTFTFQSNFLALSSYLSSRTGYSVGLMPEPNLALLAKRIASNDYPVVIVGPALALVAQSAGYTPVSSSSDQVAVSLVVKAESPIKSFNDVARKRVALAAGTDAAALGRWELVKRNVADVRFEKFVAGAEPVAAFASGGADALLMDADAAQQAVRSSAAGSGQRYRAIAGTERVPAVTTWIRRDLAEKEGMRRLADAMSKLSPGGDELKAKAFAGMARALDVTQPFRPSSISDQAVALEMNDGLLRAKHPAIDVPSVDSKAVAASRSAKAFFLNTASTNNR